MKIKYYLTFLIITVFCSLIEAQVSSHSIDISNFDFLIGKWETDFGNYKYYEEWQKENDKLTGLGYRIKDGEKFDGEKLILINIHGYISYIATVGKQQPILFAMTNNSGRKFVFENNEHDFPQKIIYHVINNDSIHVLVEGQMKSGIVKDEYNLSRSIE
ncbi:MAG: hypothetical protein KJ571_04550 [Bacteroidetes bacterium]|nr:hypothetical protein [Bacteroidota bacterium]